MKRKTVILPFKLPCLTDTGAAQLIELLQEILIGIEHHYASQIHRYHRRQCNLRQARQSATSTPGDLPF